VIIIVFLWHRNKTHKKRMPMIIYADGACRGNPGPASIGVLLTEDNGNKLMEISHSIGVGTNNRAEYQALITGLEEALQMGAQEVDIRMDSILVVQQIKGNYRVKNLQLQPLWQRAMQLLKKFSSYNIRHVPREQNSRADYLANRALDGIK